MKKSLITLGIGGFAIGLTEFVIMGILPEVAEGINVTIPEAGHFISAYALGVVIGAPTLTAFGGKWPAHKVLITLMGWFTFANTLSAFATDYYTLLFFRLLSGLPHGAFFGIGAVVATKLAEPGKAPQAIATMFAGLTIANVIGVPFGTYLGQNFSWNIPFLLTGLMGLITVTSIYFWMPALEKSSTKGLKNDLKVLKRMELWMVILLTTIGTGGLFAWYSYIAPVITNVAGHEEYVVRYAMILAGLGMFFGNILGAKFANWVSPIKAVIFSLSLMVAALIINTLVAEGEVAVLVMTFITGVIAFTIGTPIQIAMINSAKGSETIGSSMNQSAFNMGNASGAFFGGLPIAWGFGFTSSNLVGAAMAGTGILIAIGVMIYRKNKKEKPVTA